MSQLELHAYRLVKRRFKITRQQDLIKILYGELNLPVQRTPFGRICLKKSYLNVLADLHPLPKLITEYRRVQSALDRCIDPLEESINEPIKPQSLQRVRREASWQNDRLYFQCHFLTGTGRMMIHSPPLQHIPKRFQITSLSNVPTIRLRDLIIARPGYQLVSFDYSQLELRILAHLSNDEQLKTFLRQDGDFFITLASTILHQPIEEITPEQRQNAKQICYGILYGMSLETLAYETRMSVDQARDFLANFFETFATMKQYLDQIKQRLLDTGHLQSICGRALYFDANRLRTKERFRAKMERQAINFVIQASACDLMKVTMDRITQSIDRAFPHDFKTRPTPLRPVYLLLQIHDEFIFEIEMSTRGEDIIGLIREDMERHDYLHLSLPVNVKCGMNWDSLVSLV